MWLMWNGDPLLRTDESWANTENIDTRHKASEKIQVGDDGGLNLNSSSGSGQEGLNSGYFSTHSIYLFVLCCSTDITFFT